MSASVFGAESLCCRSVCYKTSFLNCLGRGMLTHPHCNGYLPVCKRGKYQDINTSTCVQAPQHQAENNYRLKQYVVNCFPFSLIENITGPWETKIYVISNIKKQQEMCISPMQFCYFKRIMWNITVSQPSRSHIIPTLTG